MLLWITCILHLIFVCFQCVWLKSIHILRNSIQVTNKSIGSLCKVYTHGFVTLEEWERGVEGPRCGVPPRPVEGEGETKSRSRGPKTSQDRPKRPRNAPKKRTSPESLRSMEPQNLAPNRSKQKDGRAAVSPLGQVNKVIGA